MNRIGRISCKLAVSLVLANEVLFINAFAQKKLTAEEIISKHIASVGTPEALAKAKSRMAIGKSEFISRMPRLNSTGQAVLASDGVDFAFHATFDLQQYPMERIGLFTNKVNIPFLKEGNRSPLGAFLLVNDKPLTDRLLGGTLFATWLLFNATRAEGKFETEGKKKINDRDTWVVRYRPKSGLRDGSSIKFYFDAETFRHVRSVFDLSEPDRGFYPTAGLTPMGAEMSQNNNVLTEDFGDYKETGGLTLPYKYSIDLTLNGVSGTTNFKWNFTIVEQRLVNDFGKGFFAFTV